MSDRDAPVVVVVPGDLHLTEPEFDNVRVGRWVVQQVNDLIRPDFVQFIGDNVQDATEAQFRLFDEIRNALEPPHYVLVGDHDIAEDRSAPEFRRHVGVPYGSLSRSGVRFIRLNTQESNPVGLSDGQLNWFREEVEEAEARGERIILFQHNYPYQIWEDFAGPGIDAWRAIVQTKPIEAIICGHTHYTQIANDGRNVSIAVRSIGDPEGGPPGYAILYVNADDLAMVHRSIEDRGPIVLITHPRDRILATRPAHIVRGPDVVSVRIWHAAGISAVRCRVDGGDWHPLSRIDDHKGSSWSAPLPVDPEAKGEHELDVIAVGLDGQEGHRSIRFMVDSTGRYTAVPETRPPVSSTGFC
jgi:3',5'-cyclic AMP phosphodiesterase CpdA